jgi:hypothetical protein
MMTERFFYHRMPRKGWVVWDRHKNEPFKSFPDSPRGKKEAEEATAMANREQRARHGEINAPTARP